MAVEESTWEYFQDHLGYTEEEMKEFKKNPRNEEVLSRGVALANKTIVAEVIESHGCNSGHKAGDTFYFDGAGNLLTSRNPKRICVYALSAAAKLIFASNELFLAGVDPNEMRFKRVGCFDVGIQCGGWGHMVMEIRMEDRP